MRKFKRFSGSEPLGDADRYLGMFTSPMKCALEASGHDLVKVYTYRPRGGACYGYNNPSWRADTGEWETYKEAE